MSRWNLGVRRGLKPLDQPNEVAERSAMELEVPERRDDAPELLPESNPNDLDVSERRRPAEAMSQTKDHHSKSCLRPVQSPSTFSNSRAHSGHSSFSEKYPGLGEPASLWHDRLAQVPAWGSTSQTSTSPDNASIVESAGFERSKRASNSTFATDPSLAGSGKSKKLEPLHDAVETIRMYQPSQEATNIWTTSFSGYTADLTKESEQPQHRSNCDLWAFWDKMGNLADALVAAKYLNDAFDLNCICFKEIFTDTGQRLQHWEPTTEIKKQRIRYQKTSKIISGTPPILQLLVKAAIGAARSCTTSADSRLATTMLDAALFIVKRTKFPKRVRTLAILFEVYKRTLAEVWHDAHLPMSSGSCNNMQASARPFPSDEEYSLNDLPWFIHPSILHREYFFLSTYLLQHGHETSLSLPARFTGWKHPVGSFLSKLALPTKAYKGAFSTLR